MVLCDYHFQNNNIYFVDNGFMQTLDWHLPSTRIYIYHSDDKTPVLFKLFESRNFKFTESYQGCMTPNGIKFDIRKYCHFEKVNYLHTHYQL